MAELLRMQFFKQHLICRQSLAISPAHCARVLLNILPTEIQRAQGMPGARCTTVTPEQPGIPRAMVLTFSFLLPGDLAFLPPSSADCSANLTPSPRCQVHTTSLSPCAL